MWGIIISFTIGVLIGFGIMCCLSAQKESEAYLEGYRACEKHYERKGIK